MGSELPSPVVALLEELPGVLDDFEAGLNGYLEVATAFDAAQSMLDDDHDRLRRSLRRARNEIRQMCRGSQRTLNELRRVERAGKGES